MIKEFRLFIARGSVIDLAVGIIIGAAFTAIVNSLVTDIITPLIGLVTGGVNFSDIFILLRNGDPAGPYQTLEAARAAGAVTINVGLFLNATINFLIVAVVVFMLVRGINRVMETARRAIRREEAEEAAAAPAPPDPAAEREERLIRSLDRLANAVERRQSGGTQG